MGYNLMTAVDVEEKIGGIIKKLPAFDHLQFVDLAVYILNNGGRVSPTTLFQVRDRACGMVKAAEAPLLKIENLSEVQFAMMDEKGDITAENFRVVFPELEKRNLIQPVA